MEKQNKFLKKSREKPLEQYRQKLLKIIPEENSGGISEEIPSEISKEIPIRKRRSIKEFRDESKKKSWIKSPEISQESCAICEEIPE